jgi:hypothetical protein
MHTGAPRAQATCATRTSCVYMWHTHIRVHDTHNQCAPCHTHIERVLHAHISESCSQSMYAARTSRVCYMYTHIQAHSAHIMCVLHAHVHRCTPCPSHARCAHILRVSHAHTGARRAQSVCSIVTSSLCCMHTLANRAHNPCTLRAHHACVTRAHGCTCASKQYVSHVHAYAHRVCVARTQTNVHYVQGTCAPRAYHGCDTRTHRCTACTSSVCHAYLESVLHAHMSARRAQVPCVAHSYTGAQAMCILIRLVLHAHTSASCAHHMRVANTYRCTAMCVPHTSGVSCHT